MGVWYVIFFYDLLLEIFYKKMLRNRIKFFVLWGRCGFVY